MTLDRRTLLTSGLAGAALLSACQTSSQATAQPVLADPKIIKLWPKGAPGKGFNATYNEKIEVERGHPVGRSLAGISDPLINLYRSANASDTAILVIPGGGFQRVWIDKEGVDICRWLNREGVHAASLVYRLPAEGWDQKEDAFMQDAKRAIRLLARETGAKRIGVMGFSAGGTLAASIATRWDEITYVSVDDADGADPKPSFMALGYAYLNVPVVARITSPYHGMTPTTPPAFFFLAADDPIVPPENSLAGFKALTDLKIPAALHVFEKGGHGFALILPKEDTAASWPSLFMTWARAGGHIS